MAARRKTLRQHAGVYVDGMGRAALIGGIYTVESTNFDITMSLKITSIDVLNCVDPRVPNDQRVIRTPSHGQHDWDEHQTPAANRDAYSRRNEGQ